MGRMVCKAGVKPRILVVDDEPEAVELVEFNLKQAGYAVITAVDGAEALKKAHAHRPDLIILDVMLPEMDGFEACKVLRLDPATARVPIIMLTAKAAEIDRVLGLELGADDYLTKPFSPKELVARVRAVLRRAEGEQAPPEVIRVGTDVELDVPRMEARIGGRHIDFTKSEFQIVAAMTRQPGRIFTRAQLLDAMRGVAFESYERAIDAHIKNIRKKIEPDPRSPRYVLTVFGVGYRFAEPPER
jgi:two-component system, OmpR family, alkaline phosphatase synthesis response regulator PhoP